MARKQVLEKKRLHELEVIRTLAFVGVVLQHILGAYVRRAGVSFGENLFCGLVFGLCKYAVPAFVFVSGVVLFLNYYKKLDYWRFLKKRLGSIVLPYLIWAILYYLYQWWTAGSAPYGKREFVWRVLSGEVSYHTWYVILILQFYLFLPLIFALYGWMERRVRTRAGFAIACGCVGAAYLLLVSFPQVFQGIPVLGKLMYELRTKNFLYYLVYFLLGGVCACHLDAFRAFAKKVGAWLILPAAALYCYVEYRLFQDGFSPSGLNLNVMGSLNIRFFFFTMVCILLVYWAALALAERPGVRRVCGFVGRHSYAAYLAHAMVISCISGEIIKWAPQLAYPAFYGILTVLTLALSMAIACLFDWMYGGGRRTVVGIYRKISKKGG